RPWTRERIEHEHELRVQRKDGPLEVLEAPHLEGTPAEELVGELRDRPGITRRVSLERVERLEVWRIVPERVVTTVLIAVLVIGVLAAIKVTPSSGASLF